MRLSNVVTMAEFVTHGRSRSLAESREGVLSATVALGSATVAVATALSGHTKTRPPKLASVKSTSTSTRLSPLSWCRTFGQIAGRVPSSPGIAAALSEPPLQTVRRTRAHRQRPAPPPQLGHAWSTWPDRLPRRHCSASNCLADYFWNGTAAKRGLAGSLRATVSKNAGAVHNALREHRRLGFPLLP
jgi:hypothetical protein